MYWNTLLACFGWIKVIWVAITRDIHWYIILRLILRSEPAKEAPGFPGITRCHLASITVKLAGKTSNLLTLLRASQSATPCCFYYGISPIEEWHKGDIMITICYHHMESCTLCWKDCKGLVRSGGKLVKGTGTSPNLELLKVFPGGLSRRSFYCVSAGVL